MCLMKPRAAPEGAKHCLAVLPCAQAHTCKCPPVCQAHTQACSDLLLFVLADLCVCVMCPAVCPHVPYPYVYRPRQQPPGHNVFFPP